MYFRTQKRVNKHCCCSGERLRFAGRVSSCVHRARVPHLVLVWPLPPPASSRPSRTLQLHSGPPPAAADLVRGAGLLLSSHVSLLSHFQSLSVSHCDTVQAVALRQELASMYEREGALREAATVLSQMPLESGQKYYLMNHADYSIIRVVLL